MKRVSFLTSYYTKQAWDQVQYHLNVKLMLWDIPGHINDQIWDVYRLIRDEIWRKNETR